MKAASGTVVSAAGRAVTALAAGIILAAGLALMWWAITPATEASMGEAMQAGIAVWGAAHFLPLTIAGSALTIQPLMLTLIVIALVAAAAGRAAPVTGARLELVHAGLIAVGYGIGVLIAMAVAAPDGLVGYTWYAPIAVAAVGSGSALLLRDSAVRRRVADLLPDAAKSGIRAAAAAFGALALGGALIVFTAMVLRFPHTMAIADATAVDAAGALGLTAIGLAYVPNAVIAAIGYASGAGFGIGDGWYSPLSTDAVDLPALPMLAIVPSGSGGWSYLVFIVPVLAALIAAVIIMRDVTSLVERLAASLVAAGLVALAAAAAVAAAGGGVAGGPWASSGAAPLLTAGLVAALVLAVPALITLATDAVPRARRVSRRPGRIDDDPADRAESSGVEGSDRAETTEMLATDNGSESADAAPDAEPGGPAETDGRDDTDEAADADEPADTDEAADANGAADADGPADANNGAVSPTEESSAA